MSVALWSSRGSPAEAPGAENRRESPVRSKHSRTTKLNLNTSKYIKKELKEHQYRCCLNINAFHLRNDTFFLTFKHFSGHVNLSEEFFKV